MATVPDTHTFTDGAAPSSEMNAYVRDPIRFLLKPPTCRVKSNATQSVATGTWTSIAFQTEDVDSDVDGVGGHDNSTNNSRYTARYAGWYLVSGTAAFAPASTQRYGVRVAVNGTATVASRTLQYSGNFSNTTSPLAACLVYLNVGDYVELQAFHEVGSPQNIGSATADNNSTMNVVWTSN